MSRAVFKPTRTGLVCGFSLGGEEFLSHQVALGAPCPMAPRRVCGPSGPEVLDSSHPQQLFSECFGGVERGSSAPQQSPPSGEARRLLGAPGERARGHERVPMEIWWGL